MKEKELRAHSTCSLCKKKLGETSFPAFYRVSVERFVLDPGAIRRQTGLGMLLGGNGFLAQVMGPDEDMAQPLMDKLILVVCEDCSTNKQYPVAHLAEIESTVKT
jgi:hypothetical protein